MVEPVAAFAIIGVLIVILLGVALDVLMTQRRIRADYQRRLRSIIER